MAEAADTPAATPAPPSKLTTATASDVSARLQQVLAMLFPSNLIAKAALFAVVVALLPLLPSSPAPRIWELPHLLLLGIIISYGVFGQKNADAEVVAAAVARPDNDEPPSVEAYVSEMMQGSFGFARNDDCGVDEEGGEDGGGVQAWSSRYLPDDPLVVVADTANNDGKGEKKPLHLPVRKLKPADEVPATALRMGDIISDGIEKEEEEEEEDGLREFLTPKKTGFDEIVRERAIPSPSSVLDADLTLSPSSPPLLPPPPPPPPPPQFLVGSGRSRLQKAKARSFNEFGVGDYRSVSGRRRSGLLQSAGSKQRTFRSKSAVQASRRSAFAGYDPAASIGYEEAAADDEGEFDDDEVVAGGAASDDDSSFGSDDDMITDNDKEDNSYKEMEDEDNGSSCDEELFELATRPGPEADEVVVGDEVDRKAEEFIAKFRDQIRMQRVVEPAPRRR